MKRPFPFLALAFAALGFVSSHAAQTGTWANTAGQELPFTTFNLPADTNAPAPVIIYLKNLAAPRVGTESDDAILADFARQGYLIATLDFAGDTNARVPFINRDLGKLRDDIRYKKFLTRYKLDDAHIFIVPEGCRLKRDVLYFADPQRPLSLDIIYPSQPKFPVGALLEFSCDNVNRMGNTSLSICGDTLLDAFATEGFAVAMADHPVAPPYKGLDAMPDCAIRIKAAVRTLRAEGEKLGLNGKIAPVGFSRGSGMALMLVTTDGMKEFENFGEHTNVSSAVQGAVVMSGRFTYLNLLPDDHMIPRYEKAWGPRTKNLETWRRAGALDYFTNATAPLFLTINCTESPDALHQMDVLRARLAELRNDATFLLDPQPRGHKVTLVPEILTAMDVYLKRQLNGRDAAFSSRYQIGVCDWMILKRQKLGAFPLTRAIGADGVEVDMGSLGQRDTFDNCITNDFAAAQFLEAARTNGLQICSVAMSGFYAQSFAERLTAPRMIDDTLAMMQRLGVRVAFLPLGVTGDLVKHPELRSGIVKRLKDAGEKAQAAGVVIGIETSLPAAEEAKLLDDIGSPAVKSYFNFANAIQNHRDVEQELRTLGKDRIVQIHCTNGDKSWLQNDPDLDFPHIKRTLDDMGWRGWLVIERGRDPKDVHNVKWNYGANAAFLKSVFQPAP